MALAGTAFSAILLVLTAMHAGPLRRDETNTISMAQMPSLKELWNNLPFESFPPLWPLLLRGCGFLGITDSDAGIRFPGLGVGLFLLAALWLCARWMGSRAPTLSIALLGSLPMFIFIMGANPGLWSGELPAGAQFRNDLANGGVPVAVTGPWSRSGLPSFRTLRLL